MLIREMTRFVLPCAPAERMEGGAALDNRRGAGFRAVNDPSGRNRPAGGVVAFDGRPTEFETFCRLRPPQTTISGRLRSETEAGSLMVVVAANRTGERSRRGASLFALTGWNQ